VAVIDDIKIALNLDPKGFEAGLKKAAGATDSAMSSISGKLKGLAAPLLGAFAAGKLWSDWLKADDIGDFAASVGESTNEIDAWGQAAEKAGGSAEGLRSSVSQMTKSLAQAATQGTGRAKKALDELGVSATDASGNTRKATDVFMQLSSVIEGRSKEEARGLLTQLGLDQGTVQLIMSGREEVERAIAAGRELGFTDEDAKAAGDFQDSWQDAKKAMASLGGEIFKVVAPAFTWLIKKAKDLAVYLRKHPEMLKTFAVGVGILAAVIKAKAIPAFLAWARAMLANPITWIVLALIGLALVIEDLVTWANGGESALGGLWEALFGDAAGAHAVWNGLKEIFSTFVDVVLPKIKAGIKAAIGFIVSLFTTVGQAIGLFAFWVSNAFTAAGQFIGNAVGAIVTFFENAWGKLKAITSAVAEAVKNFFMTAFQAVKGFIEQYIIAPIQAAIDAIKSAIALIPGMGENESEADKKKAADAHGLAASQNNTSRKRAEMYGVSMEEVVAEMQRTGQNMDAVLDGIERSLNAQAEAPPPLAPSAGDAIAPGEVTNNSTTNTENNYSVGNITVTTQATDAAGTGAAVQSGTQAALVKASQSGHRN
jgi:hypothetical protein